MLVAYNRIYGICSNYGEIFNNPYAGNVGALFDGTHTEEEIGNGLPESVQQMLRPDFLTKFNLGENLAYQVWIANDTYNWCPRAPMRLYQASGDEAVPYAMAQDPAPICAAWGRRSN